MILGPKYVRANDCYSRVEWTTMNFNLLNPGWKVFKWMYIILLYVPKCWHLFKAIYLLNTVRFGAKTYTFTSETFFACFDTQISVCSVWNNCAVYLHGGIILYILFLVIHERIMEEEILCMGGCHFIIVILLKYVFH